MTSLEMFVKLADECMFNATCWGTYDETDLITYEVQGHDAYYGCVLVKFDQDGNCVSIC